MAIETPARPVPPSDAPALWVDPRETLDGRIPPGPLADKWRSHRSGMRLVNPSNKRKYRVLVVGAGLAGAGAAASLGELGYEVECFCYQDSARRSHSVAAQGGINGAKDIHNDNDSVWRMFYDTIKGGDFRSREASGYRLAAISVDTIDQLVAQGVPFDREYGGVLATRSFGGVQVSRTFYSRGVTGQQVMLAAHQALMRQVDAGRVKMFARHEMLDLVVVDGRAAGIVARDLVSGEVSVHTGDAVVLATGGYSTIYYLSTNAKGGNASAIWRAHRRGAAFANPCFNQIHPTCIPASGEHQSKLTLMSESLRNDGRIWVPLRGGDSRAPGEIPEAERDYFLERKYPSYGNLAPRDISSRAVKEVCDEGRGVGPGRQSVYLDFADAIKRVGTSIIQDRYGNLFEMYERITGEDPYVVPMRIYPAPHFTMGGLWVDYNLMSTIPGLFVAGEANFADHGANRLGANSILQATADGYFIVPHVVGDYLAGARPTRIAPDHPLAHEALDDVRERQSRLLGARGKRTVDDFHRALGRILWDDCGMARNDAGLRRALREIPALREEFWRDVLVPGAGEGINQSLERAGRVADFMELAELVCVDALYRTESCGAHFREESQTPDGEALRDDEHFAHVAAWSFAGAGKPPVLRTEPLVFEELHLAERSYR